MATEIPMAGGLGVALSRALAGDPRIWADPDRLRSVLTELSPGNQAYQRALVAAAAEGIVPALLDAPSAAEIRLFSAKLQTQAGMDRAFADWAIRLWSSVLGLTLPEAWDRPVFEAPAVKPHVPAPPAPAWTPAPAPVRSVPPGRRTSWPAVGALCVLSLVLAGLLIQKGIFPRQKPDVKPAVPSQRAAVPEAWLSEEGNLEKLKTTFVGVRSQKGRPHEAFSLRIRSLQATAGMEGRIQFEYTFNGSGMRRDGVGVVLPLQGRLEIPDLGVGNCLFERDHLVIVGQGTSPEDLWELREAP